MTSNNFPFPHISFSLFAVCSRGRRRGVPDCSPVLSLTLDSHNLNHCGLILWTQLSILCLSKDVKRSWFPALRYYSRGHSLRKKGSEGITFLRENENVSGCLQKCYYTLIPDHLAGGRRLIRTFLFGSRWAQELVRIEPVHGMHGALLGWGWSELQMAKLRWKMRPVFPDNVCKRLGDSAL